MLQYKDMYIDLILLFIVNILFSEYLSLEYIVANYKCYFIFLKWNLLLQTFV